MKVDDLVEDRKYFRANNSPNGRVRVTLSVDADVMRRVVEAAKNDRRSLSNWIEHSLDRVTAQF